MADQTHDRKNWAQGGPRQLLRDVETTCFIVSFILLGYLLVVFLDSRIYERQADIELRPQVAAAHASGIKVASNSSVFPKDGEIVGRIRIRRLQVSVPVLEGTSARVLRLGTGHVPGTAALGGTGNAIIVGHRDTFFRSLQGMRGGDIIEINTASHSSVYKVEWTAIVSPGDTGVLETTETSTLTLVTCYPFYFIGAAPERFVVRAHRISTAIGTIDPSRAN